jgi:Flp pilus assembly pilin Flp
MKTVRTMMNDVRRFLRKEDGLVTVEWVALAGGMVVAAIAISFVLMQNLGTQAGAVPGSIPTTVTNVYGANGGNLTSP